MPYTNDSTITMRTIVTQYGKKAMAQGKFMPKTFAISDNMIDYYMYNMSDPPTSKDGKLIENMPIPLQSQYSPFYPLFNKLPGVDTTYIISLKGNTPTNFSLNSLKSYQIIPTTSNGMTESYRLIIPNTKYFTNIFGNSSFGNSSFGNSSFGNSSLGKNTATLQDEMFTLNTVADIPRIVETYGTSFQLTIMGLKSGAQLYLNFAYNPLGQ